MLSVQRARNRSSAPQPAALRGERHKRVDLHQQRAPLDGAGRETPRSDEKVLDPFLFVTKEVVETTCSSAVFAHSSPAQPERGSGLVKRLLVNKHPVRRDGLERRSQRSELTIVMHHNGVEHVEIVSRTWRAMIEAASQHL